jgi:glycosyltransferase
MRVSIITATFNSFETIGDTLESVRSQQYPDLEHIIVDGLSTDATLQKVASYPHVSKVISEKDNGIYDAMNKGIAHSTGDVVGILNSDDFYVHSKVIDAVAAEFMRTNCDALYADLQYVDRYDTRKVKRKWKSGEYHEGDFELGWMPPHPTFFVKRSVYERYGTFRLDLKSAADYELMLRLIHKHHVKLCYLPIMIVKMRTGGMSNRSFLHRLKANKEDRKAWQVNELKPRFYTFFLKPTRKLVQYF